MATIDDLTTIVTSLVAQNAALLAAVNMQKSYIDTAAQIAVSGITGSSGATTPTAGKSPVGTGAGTFDRAWIAGLEHVENTADIDKVVSTAQAAADAAVANAAASSLAAALAAKPTGMKNRLINGDFKIMQRGSVSGGGKTLDRWFVNTAGAIGACGQFTGANYGGYVTTVMTVQGANGNTGSNVFQPIEADNCQDLVGRAVTLSYWFYQSSGSPQVINAQINACNTRNNFSALTTIFNGPGITVPTGVWTKFVYTLVMSNALVANGLQVVLGTGMGALPAANNIAFGEAQLEIGSTATQFDRRDIELELLMCLRYFYPWNGIGAVGVCNGAGGDIAVKFPVPMRAPPTYGHTGNGTFVDGFGSYTTTTATLQEVSAFGCRLNFGASGTTAGRGAVFAGPNTSGQFSAELM